MDRAEAIKTLTGLLDAFDQDEYGDYFYDNGWDVCEATILSLAALREQEQMEQGCEYCREYEDLPEHFVGSQPIGRVFDTSIQADENGLWHVELPSGADIGIQFCPMCGRKLKEGAEG